MSPKKAALLPLLLIPLALISLEDRASLAEPTDAMDRGSPSSFPVMISGTIPFYPETARRTGLSGTVRLFAFVTDGEVTDIRTMTGDRILADAAAETVRTWRFADSEQTGFTADFEYVLKPRDIVADCNQTVELELPFRVLVSVPPDCKE